MREYTKYVIKRITGNIRHFVIGRYVLGWIFPLKGALFTEEQNNDRNWEGVSENDTKDASNGILDDSGR
ncbi:MAG: hypothetical protein COZ29_01735 [Candidatus Moranbacteria bacterium CG_4_10_14_3_um_filter_45_9]|nr:MAG: hypothetical protein COZ29_01735 [Candidatus Moranbacteria bacterium CG_4_10_14_3_um_filter_45_9]PJA85043.1 MAG: hypothetical protein CO143_03260 [Candidatus Moranbacteria bacterium CG_4_9_14_3_um_filter_45_14]